MFGYVVINKPELKFKEYDIYRAYYCGLCHSLKERHGYKGQISLNNDLTFIAILLSSLYEADVKMSESRCIIHPMKKHRLFSHDVIDYAADMTIALTYYKCEDDWLDNHDHIKHMYQSWLKSSFKKVYDLYPDKLDHMKKCLEDIHELEKNNCLNIDQIAGLFGQIMGNICVYKDDEWKDELYELGFFLGKFIYLMDAYDDLEKDIKEHNYNPLIQYKDRDDYHDYCFNLLEMMISRTSVSFECLPIIDNQELLRNIIYSGVWSKYVLKKKEMENK